MNASSYQVLADTQNQFFVTKELGKCCWLCFWSKHVRTEQNRPHLPQQLSFCFIIHTDHFSNNIQPKSNSHWGGKHQNCKFSGFCSKSHPNPLNCKLENSCFFYGFVSKPCSQTNSAFSKLPGNNRKRKRKPRTFQNFKNHEKILSFKKVRSILVSIGAIFTCSSVNPTFHDYIPCFY